MASNNASSPSAAPPKKAFLSVGMMAVMLITCILSLRGLASQAEYGFTSIFYYIFAAIVFLVPYALVCAELASLYPKSGGVFRWVGEAFGDRWGWVAIYLDWLMIVVWFPAVLMFGAVSLAYIFWPETFDQSLASNKLYTIIIVLGIYWATMLVTFHGMKNSNKLSTWGGMLGTIIPGAILILLGIIYLFLNHTAHPINLPMHSSFWPDFSKIGNIVLAASIFLFYAGMEVQATHIPSMRNPAKDFPKAVFMAVIVIVVIFVLGTLAIGIAVPQKDINLLQSLLVTYKIMWGALGVEWLGNIMAVFITFGVIGQVTVNGAAPALGLMAAGNAGCLPPSLQKENKHGIPANVLWVQGVIVSILSLALVLLPSVQSAYQILSQMSTIIYLLMVVLVYFACVSLRRTAPNATRKFKIPGGDFGLWLVTIVGVAGAVVAMILSFFPPDQITTGSPGTYVGILVICVVVFSVLPFLVYAGRKKEWKNPKKSFYPFTWQIEGRRPTEISKWPAGYVPTEAEVQAGRERESDVRAVDVRLKAGEDELHSEINELRAELKEVKAEQVELNTDLKEVKSDDKAAAPDDKPKQ